jgi:hypothetical protein
LGAPPFFLRVEFGEEAGGFGAGEREVGVRGVLEVGECFQRCS